MDIVLVIITDTGQWKCRTTPYILGRSSNLDNYWLDIQSQAAIIVSLSCICFIATWLLQMKHLALQTKQHFNVNMRWHTSILDFLFLLLFHGHFAYFSEIWLPLPVHFLICTPERLNFSLRNKLWMPTSWHFVMELGLMCVKNCEG